MRFESAKDMYETVSITDLYNEKLELYVFLYNEPGALCYYPIDPEEADELRKLSEEHDEEYWGAFLGIGGYILDNYDYSPHNYEPDEYTNEMYELYLKPSYEFCEEYYMHDGWEFC